MLNIKKNIENEKACFQLEGRLDTITSPELEKQLLGSLDGITDLVLDFEALDYLSSACPLRGCGSCSPPRSA